MRQRDDKVPLQQQQQQPNILFSTGQKKRIHFYQNKEQKTERLVSFEIRVAAAAAAADSVTKLN